MKQIYFGIIALILVGCASGRRNNLHMNSELSIKEMKTDLKYVERKLFKMHPDLDWYISKKDLHKKFDSVSNTISTPLKPNDFYLKIAPILSSVRQGHMSLNLLNVELEKATKKKYIGSKSPFSQFEFIWKEHNLYVLENTSKNKNVEIGSLILNINGIAPQDFYKKYRSSLTSDGYNETFIDKWFSRKIPGYYTNELGILDSITIKINCSDSISTQTIHRIFKNDKKSKQSIKTKNDSTDLVKNDSLKFSTKKLTKVQKKAKNDSLNAIDKKNNIYGYNSIKKENVIELNFPVKDSTFAVLKIRGFSGTKYKKAYKAIFNEIKAKNVQHLVLDLRGNTGGRLSEITELYSYLTKDDEYIFLKPTVVTSKWKLPFYMNAGHSVLHYIAFSPFYIIQTPIVILKTKKNKDGQFHYKLNQEKTEKRKANSFENQLFVLTDGLSFSASAIISSNLKGTNRATFIGNETGGTFNGTVAGKLPILTLPKSKLKWRLGVMSIKPTEQTEEIGRGVRPNIEVIPTVEQIINKEDPEMEWIYNSLNLKEN